METNGNDILEQQISLEIEERRSMIEERRSMDDRRNYSYTLYIPERRKTKERRSGKDRRKYHRVKAISQ